jgi:aryl-alcohol dehydrogenase-like predicted oxidoreductase
MEGALRRLGTTAVHAVLLHRPAQLLESNGPALYRALAGLKDAGLAHRIGISIYDPQELEALQGRFALDIVQLPFNILDGRWARSGWLARLNAQGTEIHARSAFLQGLLLMPPSRRPAFFAQWQSLWDAWDAWLSATGLTPLQACLRHALAVPEIARVVVGVDALAQLQEIIAAASGDAPAAPASLATQDTTLLNPAAWKLN